MQDMSTNSTWLTRTRQRWKAYVGFSFILGSCVFLAQIVLAQQGNGAADAEAQQTVASTFAFIGVGMCGVVWLGISIVCRACGARVAWRLARTKTLNEWWPTLKSLQACPVCGARNGDSEGRPVD